MAVKKNATKSKEYAESIIDTVREPLIILDHDLRVVTASRSFYKFFKVKPEDTVGQLIYDLGNKQWDIPKLRELLETILPQKATFDDYEVEHDFATIGKRIMLLNARQIERVLGKERVILLAIEDVTSRKRAESRMETALQLLKKSEKYFKEITENSSDIIIITDKKGDIKYCSRSVERFAGYKPEEIIGKSGFILIHPDDVERAVVDYGKAIMTMDSVTLNAFRIVHKDGSVLNFEGVGKNLLDNPDVAGFVMNVRDVTERNQIEAGLEKTRKELAVIKVAADEAGEFAESVINTVREPLIALDQDLRVVKISRSFYECFKVKPEETVGELIYDLGNKQWDIPKLRELLENILPQKVSFDNYEVEHEFPTIGRRIMLLNARQIERASGKEKIILLAIEDITERKEIEAGLEKTRKDLAVIKVAADEAGEFAESVINTVREPLISLDQNLRVVTVSRSFYEFFKVKPEDTVGQLIYDLGNKQWDIPKLRELLETILPEKASFDNYEVEHDFTGVGKRIMLLNARQIERASGKEKIILLAIEDITEKKKLERETLTAKDVAELASRVKSDFLANMSHELRTPLNAIIGFSEVLEDELLGALNPSQREDVQYILKAGRHLLDLINDILDLAKVESGKMQFEVERVSLNGMLEGMLAMHREKASHHGISIDLQMETVADMTIEADERKLKQILFNLLSNAVKFTPDGGSVRVVAMMLPGAKEIEISVEDTGIGIKPEDIPKLFQEFSQLDSVYDKEYGGTGLGLALTKKLVVLHGGRIRVASEFGKGSCFTFVLPVKQGRTKNE